MEISAAKKRIEELNMTITNALKSTTAESAAKWSAAIKERAGLRRLLEEGAASQEAVGPQTVSALFEAYKDKFTGTLHNLLWQVVVNGRFAGKEAAFVSNYSKCGLELGVAEYREAGYLPTGVYFDGGIYYDEASEIVDHLNSAVFGLDTDEAARIMLSSLSVGR